VKRRGGWRDHSLFRLSWPGKPSKGRRRFRSPLPAIHGLLFPRFSKDVDARTSPGMTVQFHNKTKFTSHLPVASYV